MTDPDEVATAPFDRETAPFDRCDGIHDEEAPAHYLCTRCFPHGDLPTPEGDLAHNQDADDRRAEEEEID